jgi:hypothetical protein
VSARLVGLRGRLNGRVRPFPEGAALSAQTPSPSCGIGYTYDGTFSHRVVAGSGVAAALLAREGSFVMTEEDFREILRLVSDGRPGSRRIDAAGSE